MTVNREHRRGEQKLKPHYQTLRRAIEKRHIQHIQQKHRQKRIPTLKTGREFFCLGALCRQPQQLSHPQPLLPQPQPLLPHPQPLLPQQNMITRSMIIQPHPLPNPLLHISFPPFLSQQHLMSLRGYVLHRQTLNYGIFIGHAALLRITDDGTRTTSRPTAAPQSAEGAANGHRHAFLASLRPPLPARRDHSFIVP